MTYDPARLRSQVPALASGVAFFDGPGGTQVPGPVIDAMACAMRAGLSNRGEVTEAERHADAAVASARQAGADLLGADARGIVFGRSATELTFQVARTLAQDWGPGDEVVVTRLDHDCNVRPWVTYAERAGATVRWVPFDRGTAELTVDDVRPLVGPRTRVVAVTGASNLLGTRPDIPAIAEVVRAAGSLFYVDGVHLTAHAAVDVAALGCDFYVCSPYKFLGPHLGMLAADPVLLEGMHPDKLRPSTELVPERFELGTLPYELLVGVTAAVDVLAGLVDSPAGTLRRQRVVASMRALEDFESGMRQLMREGLAGVPGMRLYGNARHKTPTELFCVDGLDPELIYRELAALGVSAPSGSFYAIEAAEWLGLGERGAVRAGVSAYTTADDIARLVEGVTQIAAGH